MLRRLVIDLYTAFYIASHLLAKEFMSMFRRVTNYEIYDQLFLVHLIPEIPVLIDLDMLAGVLQ